MYSSTGALLVTDKKQTVVGGVPPCDYELLSMLFASFHIWRSCRPGEEEDAAAAASLQYRSAIESYLDRAGGRRFAELHSAWRLVEALVRGRDGLVELPVLLLQWMRGAFPVDSRPLESEESEEFFRAVGLLACQGRTGDAAQCIELAVSRGLAGPEARLVAALLRERPSKAARLEAWRSKCERAGETTSLEEGPQTVLDILCGRHEAMLRVVGASWVELMGAHLLYVSPGVSHFELRELANRCLDLCQVDAKTLQPYEMILYSCLADEVPHAVSVLVRAAPVWMSFHMVDLIMHSQMRELREKLLLSYVSEYLRYYPEVWEMALYYLSCSGEEEARALHAHSLVTGIPPRSQQHSLHLMSACARYPSLKLDRAKAHLARYWAVRRFREQSMGDALHWARMVQEEYPALLSSLTSAAVEHGSSDVADVPFLKDYQALRRAEQAGDLQQCAALVVVLFASGAAPKKLWPQLLSISARAASYFTAGQTQQLMAYAETLSIEQGESAGGEEQMRVHEALSRNLAMTLLC